MHLLQLLQACKRQQLSAQHSLYQRYAQRFFLLCRRYLRTDAEAEEAMMNGFLKLFAALPRFSYQSDAATEAWFKRIMVNECLMHLRSLQNLQLAATDDPPGAATTDDALDRLAAEEIFRLVVQLPTGYRTVFNLHAVEGYSHKEIAEVLGISEATSRSQLHKAKQLLQQLLIQNNPEHAWRKTS